MAKLAKEAEEDAKKAEKEAKSANQPESKEDESPPPTATTRVQPDAVTIPAETTKAAGAVVPPKERSLAGSRSQRRTGASGSSSSKPSLSPEVRAAMAKPSRDRNDEEILLAASAAKAAKTESWADSTEEMLDDSLQN